jgi:iron complex outermembrane receptor protein
VSSAPVCRTVRRRRSHLVSLTLFLLPLPAHGVDPTPQKPVVEAPEVTISATRTERDVLDVPGNVTVIDREAIERSGARSVPELLRREAGLFVTNTTSNPGNGFLVEARGFQNGGGNGCHTLVLVDGRRINQPDTSCPDWSFVSIDEVDRIEVIRGPVSAAYGDNGGGGVIHILTRHGRAEPGVRAAARGRTGSYDTDGGSLLVEGGDERVTATAFVENDTTDAYRQRADFERRAQELGLRFALGEGSALTLKGGYTSVDRQQPGDLSEAEWDDDPRQAEPNTGNNFDALRERYLQARLEVEVTDGVRIELLPYHQRLSQRTELDDPTFDFDTDAEIDSLGLNSQLSWSTTPLGRRNELIVGSDLLQEDVDADSAFDDGMFPFDSKDRTRRRVQGYFLNDELWVHEDIQLSFGVRRDRSDAEGVDRVSGDDFDETHHVWSPRGALTWRVTETASAYASWARGFRFPNRVETFGFFGFAPSLAPEKSESYEVGAKLRREALSMNVALFHMNVSDEIFFDPLAINPITSLPGLNVNVDRVRHRGLELSGSWRPCEWLELYGGYTFDDVEIRQHRASPSLVGNGLPITPRHRGNAGFLVPLPYGFEVGGSAYFIGSRHLANDVENDEEKLPHFVRYDARIGWRRALNEHVELGFEVTGHNLTNRSYAEWGGVPLFGGDIGFFPSPDRHYVAAVHLELKR